jgi:hypothetical protein
MQSLVPLSPGKQCSGPGFEGENGSCGLSVYAREEKNAWGRLRRLREGTAEERRGILHFTILAFGRMWVIIFVFHPDLFFGKKENGRLAGNRQRQRVTASQQ